MPPDEQFCTLPGGLRLCYDLRGPPDGTPLLLIMGLGAQMVLWPEEFCDALAAAGFRVLRFDNRDIGRSARAAGQPSVPRCLAAWAAQRPDLAGAPPAMPYTLPDMARDALGLIDALQIPKAVVVGASMGGMIAQSLALLAPERTLGLCSIMSSPGGRWVPTPGALVRLLDRPAPGPEAALEHLVGFFRYTGGTLPFDEPALRRTIQRAIDRGMNPEGFRRQLAAVLAQPDRRPHLAALSGIPTLVLHGTADPLVPFSAGAATARAIPGARLQAVEGMGHYLPPVVWPELLRGICALKP